MDSKTKNIIVSVLERRGDRNIIVHSALKMKEDFICAIVSYDWYLNGHKKEVNNTNISMYWDGKLWIWF